MIALRHPLTDAVREVRVHDRVAREAVLHQRADEFVVGQHLWLELYVFRLARARTGADSDSHGDIHPTFKRQSGYLLVGDVPSLRRTRLSRAPVDVTLLHAVDPIETEARLGYATL